jgi:hypothetical protein
LRRRLAVWWWWAWRIEGEGAKSFERREPRASAPDETKEWGSQK